MKKPIAFNYRRYTEALEEIERLKTDKTNLEIENRILTAENKEIRGQLHELERYTRTRWADGSGDTARAD